MILYIILWWICAQLAAPVWVFVLLGAGIFLKGSCGFIKFCYSLIKDK
jgi:hypothetical protein